MCSSKLIYFGLSRLIVDSFLQRAKPHPIACLPFSTVYIALVPPLYRHCIIIGIGIGGKWQQSNLSWNCQKMWQCIYGLKSFLQKYTLYTGFHALTQDWSEQEQITHLTRSEPDKELWTQIMALKPLKHELRRSTVARQDPWMRHFMEACLTVSVKVDTQIYNTYAHDLVYS